MANAKVKATSLDLRDDADLSANVVAVMVQGTAADIQATYEDDSWVMVEAVVGGQSTRAAFKHESRAIVNFSNDRYCSGSGCSASSAPQSPMIE